MLTFMESFVTYTVNYISYDMKHTMLTGLVDERKHFDISCWTTGMCLSVNRWSLNDSLMFQLMHSTSW